MEGLLSLQNDCNHKSRSAVHRMHTAKTSSFSAARNLFISGRRDQGLNPLCRRRSSRDAPSYRRYRPTNIPPKEWRLAQAEPCFTNASLWLHGRSCGRYGSAHMIKTRTRFVFGDGPSEHRGTTRADPSRDAKAKGSHTATGASAPFWK